MTKLKLASEFRFADFDKSPMDGRVKRNEFADGFASILAKKFNPEDKKFKFNGIFSKEKYYANMAKFISQKIGGAGAQVAARIDREAGNDDGKLEASELEKYEKIHCTAASPCSLGSLLGDVLYREAAAYIAISPGYKDADNIIEGGVISQGADIAMMMGSAVAKRGLTEEEFKIGLQQPLAKVIKKYNKKHGVLK